MERVITILTLLITFIAVSGVVYAGSVNGTLDVTANVIGFCDVMVTGVDFGNVVADGSLYYANGDVSVACDTGVPYNIAMDAGMYFDGISRQLSDGFSGFLHYHLFKDGTYTQEYGDSDYDNTFPLGSSLSDIGDGTWQAHTVYGQLVTLGGEPVGSYADTVTVTVYY